MGNAATTKKGEPADGNHLTNLNTRIFDRPIILNILLCF